MGLFDFLRRKKGDSATEPEPEPKPAKYEWQPFEDEANQAFARGVLEDVSHAFGPDAKIVLSDDDKLELRGRYEGRPIRFVVWLAFGSFWRIEMQLENGVDLRVRRDPKAKIKPPAGNDPWASSSSEETSIYVGRSTFLQSIIDVSDDVARWRDAPTRVRALVLSQLEALGADRMSSDETSGDVSVDAKIQDLTDPLAFFEDCAAFLFALEREPDDEPERERFDDEGAERSIAGVSLGHCESCQALYPFDLYGSCPNCGTPRV